MAKAKGKAKAPKKRRLSQTKSAKRARAARAAAKVEAETKAKARERAARKRRRAAKVRKLELESIREGERERKRDEKEKAERRRAGDERQLLIDVMEEMRNDAPISLSLDITEAEVGARIPWLVVGRFEVVRSDLGYAALHAVFASWRDNLILEARIHPQRLSQIRIVFHDPHAKRKEGDSIVSTSGAWEAVISEQAHELDPSDEDSLASRYADTTVPLFYVYFSGQLASEVEISL